jgi:dTDP-4-dehydrorhamnose reductase
LKVLVLGGSGQVGHDVLAAGMAAHDLDIEGMDQAGLDLRDVESIGARLADFRFDVLIKCAAYTQVGAAEGDAAAAFTANAHAVEAIAAACARRGARLVHLSTDYVFGGDTDRPYRTDDAPAPLSVYGASKLVGEALARRAHPEGTVIVRTSSVFGLAGARPGGGNFIETMIRLGRERGRLSVGADNVMAPTFSADLARGLLELARLRPSAGTYHLTNEGRTSWHDPAVAALELAGIPAGIAPIPATDYPTPARSPAFSVLDTRSTTALAGPMPAWDALRRYLQARARERVPSTDPTT